MSEPIDILVLADRDAKTLWPITDGLPPPLLPLGGKPLIAHVIEALSTCVAANVTVVVAADDERTPTYLAACGYPRLAVSVTSEPVAVVDRDMLVFRGDIVMSVEEIREFVGRHGVAGSPARHAPEQGAWRLAAGELTPTWRHTAMLTDNSDRLLPTIAAYCRMNLAAANGELRGLTLAGWVGPDGVRTGLDARVVTRRAPGVNVQIGDRAFVDKLVALGDNVTIGADAFIAKGAMLADAIVMPGSYVGPGVELRNVVVAGGWLCRIDTGTVIRVADATVLGRVAA